MAAQQKASTPSVGPVQAPVKAQTPDFWPLSWKLWHPDHGVVFASSPAKGESSETPALPRVSIRPVLARAPVSPQTSRISTRFIQTYARRTPSTEADGRSSMAEKEAAEDEVDEGAAEDEAEEFGENQRSLADLAMPPALEQDYQLDAQLFRAAKEAPPGTAKSFWSYAMYRNAAGERVKVHYCRSKHTTERVCKAYFLNEPLMGFDLEWMPSAMRWQGPRSNVCLVQLATPRRIGLFHVALYPAGDSLVAPTLRQIMEDPEVTKLGVAIRGDATRLRNYLGIEARGILELSHLHKLVKYSQTGELGKINKRLVPLAVQVEDHLRLPMFKGHDVRSSDWSKPLSMDQIIYSASDAFAAVQIYYVLEKERESLKPTPPRPAHAELERPIRVAADVPATAATAAEGTATEVEAETEEDTGDADEVAEAEAETAALHRGKEATDPSLTHEYLAKIGNVVEVETDADTEAFPEANADAAAAATPRRKGASPTKRPLAAGLDKPKDERVKKAEEWLTLYRASSKTVRAKPASLRAYRMWHDHDDLNASAIASILRDPPLLTNTVIGYILDAIRLEKLPYSKPRMKELLDQLPANVVMMRYQSFARICGYSTR